MIVTTTAQPISSLVSLAGRTAVVTGAAQGIGSAIALRLYEAGAKVALVDRDDRGLHKLAENMPDHSRRLVQAFDVTDDDSLRACVETTVDNFSGVDIWVNNAGISPRENVLGITKDQWDGVMSLNLRAGFVGAQAAARSMIETQRPGVIVNMLSSCIYHVGGNPAHYRASKAGLRALTESLAVELGRHSIRVIGIAPTLIDTPAVAALRDAGAGSGLDEFIRRLPLRRIGTADEVARVVLFAVSEMASLMTGCVLNVDAGEMAK